ncbi:adenosylcobinamide amidohydrolase [Halonotius roseus]|uniref:Adenosylcobinamide amidohydrolase n=1 Tax=Halonotius roseus TaxID=2511997 RepID=A0A544QMD1_9EURY|nr:adenosylcobinamide amidohydrolase [Halonotius roseus]
MFETTITDGVLQARRPHTDWLSTGVDGGRQHADAAYNVTVPTGWEKTDLRAYIDRRVADAGFDADGPALLTGVEQRHARRAALDPVEAIVTAGLSNPATLPPRDSIDTSTPTPESGDAECNADHGHPGTINIIVGTSRALPPAALASLLASVVEAKTATLARRTGFTGTTSDAVIVGSDPDGEPTRFVGSATAVGNAARACVRDGLTAALDARYQNEEHPESVGDADHGIETTATATVSTPR